MSKSILTRAPPRIRRLGFESLRARNIERYTVPCIGITGNPKFSRPTAALIRVALHQRLADEGPGELHGVTYLSDGADQIFAAVVSEVGGGYGRFCPLTTTAPERLSHTTWPRSTHCSPGPPQ